MTNDNPRDVDDLSPAIVDELRNVSPADDAMRNRHIGAALDHLVVGSRPPLLSWLGIAAAAIALVAGGVVMGRATSQVKSTNASGSPAAPASTLAPKGDLSATTVVPACGTVTAGTYIGSYTVKTLRWLMFATSDALIVVDAATCKAVARTPLPTIP